MLVWFSPCKINLFLQVVSRNERGSHNVHSLMQTLDFGDYIVISDSERDVFFSSNEQIPVDRNLVILARDLFRAKTGLVSSFNIFLQKNIPLASGLGGGSGNAATTLFALNQMSGLGIPEDELRSWSTNLGADVPFFFSSGRAICNGAENLSVVDTADSCRMDRFALVFPNVPGFPTKDIFARFEVNKLQDWSTLALEQKIGRNDLESAALSFNPQFAQIKETLVQALDPLGEQVFMTGSGSTLVTSLHNQDKVFQKLKNLKLNFVFAEPIFREQPSEWFQVAPQESFTFA